MQFEVNGQDYFLNFVPEAGRWFLLKPTRSGFAGIPVVTDEAPMLLAGEAIVTPGNGDIIH